MLQTHVKNGRIYKWQEKNENILHPMLS